MTAEDLMKILQRYDPKAEVTFERGYWGVIFSIDGKVIRDSL